MLSSHNVVSVMQLFHSRYFGVCILSFHVTVNITLLMRVSLLTLGIQKNKAGRIIILYDEDERIAPQAATVFVQRGVDNAFMLSGGMCNYNVYCTVVIIAVSYLHRYEGSIQDIPYWHNHWAGSSFMSSKSNSICTEACTYPKLWSTSKIGPAPFPAQRKLHPGR